MATKPGNYKRLIVLCDGTQLLFPFAPVHG